MADLDFESRSTDLKNAREFGNHKGATKHPELLRELVHNDITYVYGLVLPLSKIQRIPGRLISPNEHPKVEYN